MTNKKTSVYKEIRTEHIEDDGVFHILHVDAWKTDDDDEEGTVIAKIIGVNLNGTFHHSVQYRDNILSAYTDVESAIREGLESLNAHMNDIYGQKSS